MTILETEITVTNLRMLFAGNNRVSTLNQQWFDIASGLGDLDRFFFSEPSLLVGVRLTHEHKCFAEGKASILVSISEMIPIAVNKLV